MNCVYTTILLWSLTIDFRSNILESEINYSASDSGLESFNGEVVFRAGWGAEERRYLQSILSFQTR